MITISSFVKDLISAAKPRSFNWSESLPLNLKLKTCDLFEDPDQDKLNFIVGSNTDDPYEKSYIEDLAKLPHLLVAGTTGSGKSVFLNSIIASLLLSHEPKGFMLGLVDPKQVEFSMYKTLPNLLGHEVFNDIYGAASILDASVTAMEARLQFLEQKGFKDLSSYNKTTSKPIPRWVIIVDEFSDLILSSRKGTKEDKEAGSCFERDMIRIAQKARAAGIHLILSTQKPVVQVVDTLLKGNIPARAAFRVATASDSRVILDGKGAEQLLGHGDMLFKAPEFNEPKRFKGVYFPDEVLKSIIMG
jgi:S-DNA-T family DNA segregation ATPase FtsK/SpoIIIE